MNAAARRRSRGSRPVFWAVIVGFTILQPHATKAEERALEGVALIIGNSGYEYLPELPNPIIDARALESLLSDLGFRTTLAHDRDARRMRRDLDNFIEDATGSDVAVVYYAGHGIEAGGDNFLLPVDADIASTETAAASLVSLSEMLERLNGAAGLTIVLLDACRENPFPPDQQLRLTPDGDPLPIAEGGLEVTRGAIPLSPEDGDNANLGTFIGLAASPGAVALDGQEGTNSPYAAALLRHVGAMTGEEFGTVMRMVGEEVYLKTEGVQRPWINENLRRLVYLGESLPDAGGIDGRVLEERRALLVRIAELPDADRAQIKRIARQGDVPMDSLFAMLNLLGAAKPSDPAKLEHLLIERTETLRSILHERSAMTTADPEIVRLSELARRALAEGALETAIELHGDAKARVGELEGILENAEAAVKQRRIEFANVFRESAETNMVGFHLLAAADDYRAAFEQVKGWDSALAASYLRSEAETLLRWNVWEEDVRRRALDAVDNAIALVSVADDPSNWAALQDLRGRVHWQFRVHTFPDYQSWEASSIAAYQAALTIPPEAQEPLQWARTQVNLAKVLMVRARLDIEQIRGAISTFQQATGQSDFRLGAPLEWASAQMHSAMLLNRIFYQQSQAFLVAEALETAEAMVTAAVAAKEALSVEDHPIELASVEGWIGTLNLETARIDRDTAKLETALQAFNAAAETYPYKDSSIWLGHRRGYAEALLELGVLAGSDEKVEETFSLLQELLAAARRFGTDKDVQETETLLAKAASALEAMQ